MPTVSCPCGATFQAQPGDAPCPTCGAVHTVDALPVVLCECGEAVELPSRETGARRVCPACGKLIEVREPGAPVPASGPIPAGLRLTLSILFVLAFVPLLFGPDRERVERVKGGSLRTVNEVKRWFENLRADRTPGAAYERGSSTPWILSIVAAEVFWAYLLVAFPWGGSTLRKVLGAGALVLVTAGVAMLLFKWGAAIGDSGSYRPRGKSALVYYLLKFLGFSYQAGFDPRNGFFTSWISFTFGAGFLLSLCRTLPVLLWYRKSESLDVRGAVSWGLVGGASAGAMQAAFTGGSFFDGIAAGGTYVEMIVSGTAMSVISGGIAALLLWRLEEDVLVMDGWKEWLILILAVGLAGSAPHALYDTLWKSGATAAAFAVGVAAFLAFFGFYGWAVRKEKLYAAAA